MANYNSLKATIDAQIKANGVQAITGPILNAVLTAMINTIGNGYTLQGSVAQTTDNPGAPDNPVAYLAAGPGTYTNFGATVIPDDGHAYLLTWDTSWHAVQLPLPTYNLANGKQDALTFDNVPTLGSDNPVKSDGIAQELDDKQDKDTGDTVGHVAVMDGNGNSVDGGEALSNLATKEDVEAVEQEVAQVAGEAGLAEAVIDADNAGTEQEFTFRKSGGDGGAYYRKIKGKTLGWNQLAHTPISTLTGPAYQIAEFTAIAGHKYLIRGFVSRQSADILDSDYQIFCSGNQSVYNINQANAGGGTHFYIILEPTTTGTQEIWATSYSNFGGDVTIQLNAHDLTLATLADLTAAQFEALYPDIYPHNTGKNISNDAEAVETTGVNQWDEEWGNYLWDEGNGGVRSSNSNSFGCAEHIPVLPSTNYYLASISGGVFYVLFYDAEKNFISYQYPAQSFTTPANCAYITFYSYQSYGTTYNHDICINLSNPAIDGQYFPYWKRTLQLGITTKEDTDGNVPFADGMKGVGTAADWADKVGGEKRMRRINLGDLDYVYNSTPFSHGASIGPNFNCPLPSKNDNDSVVAVCARYTGISATGAYTQDLDKICTIEDGNVLKIKDSAYTDAATFKAAMQGVYLDYALATPVPFTWKEPLNLGVKVDENGTERAVAPEGATAPSAPFVADTTYTMSIARMVAILQGI